MSDGSRLLVPIQPQSSAQAGDLVERAGRLVRRAQQLLELAVIVEREQGTAWEVVGRALGVSRQAVHERFSPAIERWKQGVREPWVAEHGSHDLAPGLPPGADDPGRWAAQLDEWVTRQQGLLGSDAGERPVSAGLPPAGERELEHMYLEQLTAITTRLTSPDAETLHPAVRRELRQHRAELLSTLAALRPDAPAYAEAAAHARDQLAAGRRRPARTRRR